MQKKKLKKSKSERQRRFIKWFWIIGSSPFAVLFILILLISFGVFGKLPSFEELENPKNHLATELYSEEGRLLGKYFIENRSYVEYDELSPALIAALVSTEDERYYQHSGIDFTSLARVVIKTVLLGRKEQGGGSTITQQLAKNLFPRESSLSRKNPGKVVVTKLKEWITAVKLEYNYTKEEIIVMYLNEVLYGHNAHGIKSAARTFFDKSPSELTVPEAALLVGVVNAPSRYSPINNPERATNRRNLVMTRMCSNKHISHSQLDSLKHTSLNLNYTPVSHNEGIATYFREMIRLTMTMQKPQRSQFNRKWDYDQALAQWENNPLYGWCHKNKKKDGSSYDIYRDGLKIYTTVNYVMQQYAEESVHNQLKKSVQPAMDAQFKRTKSTFVNTSKEMSERIISTAMRYTDRYISLKEDGASSSEIDKSFRTPAKMRVFTYKGYVDTLMTPRDSILYYKRLMRASFMAMDPNTGYVKAYVGGPNFRHFKYDMVKQGKRQVGSTIKPFVYTFAIDYMGFSPCTMVPNLPVTIETYTGEPWTPKEAVKVEYDGLERPLKWGLARSRNNYSAWIMKQAKQPKAVADFINRMGIHSYIDPVHALCLGPADVSLFEMVGAYSTFAHNGIFTEPIFVTRIEDKYGNLLASFTPKSADAISATTAYTMLQMLKEVVSNGTAGRLNWQFGLKNVEIGGKTGTSQENRDAWFIGVTPKIVGGAWVGGEDQSVYITAGGEGSAMALPIFGEFIKKVYETPELGVNYTDKFQRPAGAADYRCPEVTKKAEEEDTAVVADEFFD